MIKVLPASEFTLDRHQTETLTEQREAVLGILAEVREKGDLAVREFTKRFDGAELDDLRIPEEMFAEAYSQVTPAFVAALREAIQNIRAYHEAQIRTSWMLPGRDGTLLGQIVRPLKRVGVYVPGGSAPLPSTALMNVIPAQVAGVSEIAVATPPDEKGRVHPSILVALHELGITEAYRMGGAQAIGALAYGTETIRPVDKITGPGNVYVALAKQAVFGLVAIDMIAGPSDILVLADETADPDYVAADLLSQAEHDPMAQSICVTTSHDLAGCIAAALGDQLKRLPRREIAEQSIRSQGAILVAKDLDEAIEVANRIAPEHLELIIANPLEVLGRIENAGAIFLGPYSTEPVGDYFAGPNHTLPTYGTARFSSPLSVDDFVKKSSVIQYGKQALLQNGAKIIAMAETEGLDAHANAVRIRLQKEGGTNG
jgi:histidinol dehydrogenase